MKKLNKIWIPVTLVLISLLSSCVPAIQSKVANKEVPEYYGAQSDTLNTAKIEWKDYFADTNLAALIDTALMNNQELNIIMQEIAISRNEVGARKGEYLPFLDIGAGAGVDKTARYTPLGANEATTEILPGKEMPDPVPDFMFGARATWEIDIWNKLHNAKDAAISRYLASIEGRNFMVTNLIAEIANSYYELMALDNQLEIVNKNIEIQRNALKVVKLQKESANATELAVRRFEAEVLKNRSRRYEIQQRIIETENRINFLVGRFPQPVQRSSKDFVNMPIDTVLSGIPSQLLQNRPDIRAAELELMATDLDIKSARANFYPRLDITAGIGFQAFNPTYLLNTPESMLYSLAGDLSAPLINRNAIKAQYFNANARQVQAAFEYERTILNAYVEVVNQLSQIKNLKMSYSLKSEQVSALTESISISTRLYRSARADYMEVLLTQRDALDAKMELIETRKLQMNAKVNIYQALGGGWN